MMEAQDCLKINLTTFDGNQTKWENFRNLFKSLVHDIDRIPPVKKMQYLNNYLTGEAAEVTTKMKITAKSYSKAWDQLLKHYDNPRLLLKLYVSVL